MDTNSITANLKVILRQAKRTDMREHHSKAKLKNAGASAGGPHHIDRLSPGSVLEHSFSNDSCFSSSLDDCSGHKLIAGFMDCRHDEPKPLPPDVDLLDSATSISKWRTARDFVTDLLNHIAEVLCSIDQADARLKGSKLTHAKKVILNAELVFGNAVLHDSHRTKDFSITRFLLEELETLASIMWTNCSCFFGFDDTKEGNLLVGFVFDCVVEYLDSRYGQFSKCGYKSWTRVPCMDMEMLIHGVIKEVRRWTGLVGLIPDELIEREMSYSLGKWTDFEVEAFENGVEVGEDILENLVDEFVIDLWECGLGSYGSVCSSPR